MISETLQYWMLHPQDLNRDTLSELRALMLRYPYFQSLRLLLLKNLYMMRDGTFGDELRKSVMFVANRRVLFNLIEGTLRGVSVTDIAEDNAALAGEKELGIDRTLTLIDAFLSTMPEEHSERMELDYTMDYMAYLMHEKDDVAGENEVEEPKLKGHELIDGFIRESESAKGGQLLASEIECPDDMHENMAVNGVLDDELDDSYFTETLARIYIRQHRYEKALEIIKKLSLNFPKKSAYFASTIKELEQMIINAKSK